MRKALCIGINDYPGVGDDLRGCVNDARAWAAVLSAQFDFPAGDVRLLLDRDATKAGILAGLDALLAGTRSGDVLALTISSHGTYVADTSGDEEVDEAICPWDMRTELLLDDELREKLSGLKRGVRLTVVSDSCHSGSLTRLAGDDQRPRFVRPSRLGLPELDRPEAARPRGVPIPESKMKEILVSGCTDRQTSIDAKFGRTFHGAMTFYALEIMREAAYRITYQELWDRLVVRLDENGFDQEPQVEGKAAAKRRQMFA